ncbi:MAG: hypothetical protein JWN76_122 [Chitinophagaceae bacterium]|nr:hypothetical protein [Chitinophagaceae bacterium]
MITAITGAVIFVFLMTPQSKTIFHKLLSDDIPTKPAIAGSDAERLFNFFRDCKLFRWSDANNDCEDRANAICILLDAWNVPNYKGWVFSGYYLKKNFGSLHNYWNFHVAACVPIKENGITEQYIIDPATSDKLVTIADWAEAITMTPYSYHLVKSGHYYIFPAKKIEKDNWYKRDKRNTRWTMQGLTGINGVSAKGRAQLSFNKHSVVQTEKKFRELERRGIEK